MPIPLPFYPNFDSVSAVESPIHRRFWMFPRWCGSRVEHLFQVTRERGAECIQYGIVFYCLKFSLLVQQMPLFSHLQVPPRMRTKFTRRYWHWTVDLHWILPAGLIKSRYFRIDIVGLTGLSEAYHLRCSVAEYSLRFHTLHLRPQLRSVQSV